MHDVGLPEVEELGHGATAYWLDGGLRRILVIEDGGCYTVFIDLYARRLPEVPGGLAEHLAAPTASSTRIHVARKETPFGPVELRVLETSEGLEVIAAATRLCGERPSRDTLEKLYAYLAREVEGRDPIAEPLSPPEPVERVYRARGFGRLARTR